MGSRQTVASDRRPGPYPCQPTARTLVAWRALLFVGPQKYVAASPRRNVLHENIVEDIIRIGKIYSIFIVHLINWKKLCK